MRNRIPSMMITGFLESGKTTFLNLLFTRGDFKNERLMILMCEDGEEEIDAAACSAFWLSVHKITRDEILSENVIRKLLQDGQPDRVIIEMNGMWKLSELMPHLNKILRFDSVVMMLDASRFRLLYHNLKLQISEQSRFATQIMVNRENGEKADIESFVSNFAKLAILNFQKDNGEYEAEIPPMRHQFPDTGRIEIDNCEYFAVYRDVLLHPAFFEGRKFSVCGGLLCDDNGDWRVEQTMMVCCAEDVISVLYPCEFNTCPTPKQYEWKRIVGTLSYRYHRLYGRIGPVIEVDEMLWEPPVFYEM